MLRTIRTTESRAWFAAGIPILSLVLVSMVVALAMLWSFAREQDRGFADSSSRLVESSWHAREQASARLALDYAVWNDAYLSTTVRWSSEWAENNLFSNVADGVFVVRPDGTVRYAWLAEAAAPQTETITAGVVSAVQHGLNLGALVVAARKEDMTVTTTIIAGGAPMLVSVAPISPEEETVRQTRDPDLPVDYIVIVDLVTPEELFETGANLELTNLRFTQPPIATPVGDEISRLMQAASDAYIGALTWDRERPGSAAFLRNAGIMTALFLVLGAAAVWLALKLVSNQVRAVAEVSVANEAIRVKSEFISTMSHELRTPLNAIMGYTELIKEEIEDGATAETLNADADRVLAAAKHLLRLVNDVLDQSRFDAGKLEVSNELIEVAAVLEELEQLMAPLAQANANRLTVTVDEGARVVMADPMRLQQCLINVTSNALKFTRAGQVEVHARRLVDHANGYIVFEIRDTGIGMDAAELDGLFKPFTQANKQVSAKYGGAGLGLSISRNLARAMGGDITATSALGKGSVFCLRLLDGSAGPRLVHAA